MNECIDEKKRLILMKFCTGFLALMNEHDYQDDQNRFWREHVSADFKTTFDEMTSFCRMVCTLFRIEDVDDIGSVNFFLKYKGGPSLFARSIRAALNGESDSRTGSELQQSTGALWKSLVTDTIRTASTAPILRPQMRQLQLALQSEPKSPKDLVPHILEGCTLLPKFKQGLRTGEPKQFESLLAETLVKYIDDLCAETSDEKRELAGLASISSQDISKLTAAMNIMNNNAKVLAAEGKLVKFATSFNKRIAVEDLLQWALRFNKIHDEETAKSRNAHCLDAQELKALLQKCGEGDVQSATGVIPELAKAVQNGIKEMYVEAGIW